MFKNLVSISQRTLKIYYQRQMLSKVSGKKKYIYIYIYIYIYNNIHSENHTKPGNTLCEENVKNYN